MKFTHIYTKILMFTTNNVNYTQTHIIQSTRSVRQRYLVHEKDH